MVKLEKRCLRFIYNDYISTYSSMLQMYNMDGIHVTLFKNILTEVFKCLNEINPTYLCERFTVKSVPYNLRNDSYVLFLLQELLDMVRTILCFLEALFGINCP